MLHGGFWRMPHGRDQLHAIAGDLARRGLPLRVPQLVIHGSDDLAVPVAIMEFLDPTSVAHEALCGRLGSRFA